MVTDEIACTIVSIVVKFYSYMSALNMPSRFKKMYV